jgi:L-aminopeptidase/D-esterase-like protein
MTYQGPEDEFAPHALKNFFQGALKSGNACAGSGNAGLRGSCSGLGSSSVGLASAAQACYGAAASGSVFTSWQRKMSSSGLLRTQWQHLQESIATTTKQN